MIRQTYDMEAVNTVLQHPDIWKDIAPEGVPTFDAIYLPYVLYFLVNDGDGIIMFHPYREGLMIHPNILPKKRGKLAYEAVDESIKAVFDDGCECVYAEIDPKLKHVTLFARALGFRLLESNDRDLFIRRRLHS